MPADEFTNPMAPPDIEISQPKVKEQPLSNKDFRKLLETPRPHGGPGSATERRDSGGAAFTHRQHADDRKGAIGAGGAKGKPGQANVPKKKNYPRGKREEDEDDLNSILKNYRDRAKERRVGEGKDSQEEMLRMQRGGYRAVAPDARTNLDAAQRRKQMIQESKYLGGDMEHTHLVKGLDYALLQKVRSEIVSKEHEEEQDLETVYQDKTEKHEKQEEAVSAEPELQIKAPMAKNIYRQLFKDEQPKVNELFAPRRMAYVMELDDENPELADIPTTLIRSRADCPVEEATTNLNTNDMVIQKLTQVLSYLRQDNKRSGKKNRGDKPAEETTKISSQSIYDDVGEYVPSAGGHSKSSRSSNNNSNNKDRRGDHHHSSTSSSSNNNNSKKTGGSYFGTNNGKDDESNKSSNNKYSSSSSHHHHRSSSSSKYSSSANKSSSASANKSSTTATGGNQEDLADHKSTSSSAKKDRDIFEPVQTSKGQAFKVYGSKSKANTSEYAECYPGGFEAYDAAGESDDEADFTKMDVGAKKGPIKRWDFENEEQYGDWMSKKEALPKAAFQYGVKANDGRKTRKSGVGREQQEKNKIDKEWTKISKILSNRSDEPSAKRSK